MKKLLSLLTITTLLFGSVFAYSPTAKDKALIAGIGKKIEKMSETNPKKLEKISEKLDLIVTKFAENTKEHYILNSIHLEVKKILGTHLEEKSETLYKIVEIIDGDTLKISDGDEVFTIRLLGIDTPETSDDIGKASKEYLENLLGDNKVTIESDTLLGDVSDDYERKVVYLYIGDTLVNQKILEDGYARELTYDGKYAKQLSFKKAEQTAQQNNIGIRKEETDCEYKRYCTQMDSCQEALHYLNECNVYSLDADGDGIPCESLCGG